MCVMVCCPIWRAFAEKSPAPMHPGTGMVTVHLQVSLVLQENKKSGLHFSIPQNKIKIAVNLRPLKQNYKGHC